MEIRMRSSQNLTAAFHRCALIGTGFPFALHPSPFVLRPSPFVLRPSPLKEKPPRFRKGALQVRL